MISFAAIVPHSPVLIKNESSAKSKITRLLSAYENLSFSLIHSRPTTLILLAPTHKADRYLTIYMAGNFQINFNEFGIVGTNRSQPGNSGLAQLIKDALHPKIPTLLAYTDTLPYQAGLPAQYLLEQARQMPLVVLRFGQDTWAQAFQAGKIINDLLCKSKDKFALVATSDFSRDVKLESLDDEICKNLKEKDSARLVNMSEKKISKAGICGFRPVLALTAAMEQANYHFSVLTKNRISGVNLIVAEFKF